MFLLQKVTKMRTCLSVLISLKFKDKLRVLLKKNISDGNKMSENVNGAISEREFPSA